MEERKRINSNNKPCRECKPVTYVPRFFLIWRTNSGRRIRYYRKRQKMTLRELGEKSGFENRGDVRIAQYENGSRVPRTGTLNRIAKALGIPPEELFCEDCRKCMFLKNYYRKKRKSHTTFDMGIEEDNSYREHKNPDDEGILYDNLD